MKNIVLTPVQKALEVNLNPETYGTFAEVGAGQEVVRHFLEQVVHLEQLQKRCLPMIKTLAMRYMEKKQMEIRL